MVIKVSVTGQSIPTFFLSVPPYSESLLDLQTCYLLQYSQYLHTCLGVNSICTLANNSELSHFSRRKGTEHNPLLLIFLSTVPTVPCTVYRLSYYCRAYIAAAHPVPFLLRRNAAAPIPSPHKTCCRRQIFQPCHSIALILSLALIFAVRRVIAFESGDKNRSCIIRGTSCSRFW